MLEAGGGLDLLDEPVGAQHRREFRLQDLERDLAVVLEILGQEHRGHPTCAELALDAVAVGQSRGEAVGEISHLGARYTVQGARDDEVQRAGYWVQ